MEILLHDGKREVVLRGEDGQFELCYESLQPIAKGSKEKKMTFVPKKYFGSVEGAVNALLRMKVSNSDSRTLSELVDAVNLARIELRWPV